jgi:hypothetical protein
MLSFGVPAIHPAFFLRRSRLSLPTGRILQLAFGRLRLAENYGTTDALVDASFDACGDCAYSETHQRRLTQAPKRCHRNNYR